MKILITGGCGYIGSLLTQKLLNYGYDVTVFDIQWFGNYLQQHKKLKIIKDDIRNIRKYSLKKYPIYHWSDSGITSWHGLALEIYSIALKIGLIENNKIISPIKSLYYKTNAKRPLFSALDCNSTEKLLNINRIPWQKSIEQMLIDKLKGKTLNI